jgi:hypothetical protein
MNLEKDMSPTGLYNYLPKVKSRRKRRTTKRSSKGTRRRAPFKARTKKSS